MEGIDYTFCELREKEVVNIADGKKLGRIMDICIHCSGKVVGIVCPGEKKIFKNFSSGDGIFVPWQSVVRIGDDVILVQLTCNNGQNIKNEAFIEK